MITIEIYPLVIGAGPMFRRTFTRPADAQDYIAFWKKLGHSHAKPRLLSLLS